MKVVSTVGLGLAGIGICTASTKQLAELNNEFTLNPQIDASKISKYLEYLALKLFLKMSQIRISIKETKHTKPLFVANEN